MSFWFCGLLIGWAGAGTAPAQGPDLTGWIFDSRAVAETLPRLEPPAKFDLRTIREEVWRSAWSQGPASARRWDKGIAGSGHDPMRFTLLAALGLAGGPSARDSLDRWLDRGRSPADTVLACLAASRARVAFPPQRLLRLANDRKRREVERLAARFALLALSSRLSGQQFVEGSPDRAFDGFWSALHGVVHPSADLALPVQLAESPPEVTSPAALEQRAVLLLAASRPQLFGLEPLVRALQRARGERERGLASLALGRRRGAGRTDSLTAWSELEQSMFLCGLESADVGLQARLLEGPSGARGAEWRSRWWAATVRLLSGDLLDREASGLVDSLLSHGTEGEAGLLALCHRVLMPPAPRLRLTPATRAKLAAPAAGPADRARVLLAMLTLDAESRPPDGSSKALGERLGYALTLHRDGRLGEDPGAAARLLWRYVQEEGGGCPVPGTVAGALCDELNQLVRETFIAGSRIGKELRGLDGYLPDGIRAGSDDYFEILDQLLQLFPIFRG